MMNWTEELARKLDAKREILQVLARLTPSEACELLGELMEPIYTLTTRFSEPESQKNGAAPAAAAPEEPSAVSAVEISPPAPLGGWEEIASLLRKKGALTSLEIHDALGDANALMRGRTTSHLHARLKKGDLVRETNGLWMLSPLKKAESA